MTFNCSVHIHDIKIPAGEYVGIFLIRKVYHGWAGRQFWKIIFEGEITKNTESMIRTVIKIVLALILCFVIFSLSTKTVSNHSL